MSEVQSTFQLKPGERIPAFSLPTPEGRMLSSDDLRGPQGILLVFACNHCPYVVHLADALGDLARDIAPLGITTVAINSNDVVNYPQDRPELMTEFAGRHRWDFPYLFDESQEVATAYAAACTPDFYLANGNGELFYAGQFDETRPRGGHAAHGGDLREAIRRMLGGEPPPARFYPSSGCNIKWKPGNQPEWF